MKPLLLIQILLLAFLIPQSGEGIWKHGPDRVSNAHSKPANKTLFYIERNKNANTVFYDVNFDKPGQINEDHPIDVYYILYAVDSRRQNLSMIERLLAYGYDSEMTEHNRFKIRLKAFPSRPIILTVDKNNEIHAEMKINGQRAQLERIYVKAKPQFYTTVEYVELLGTASESGEKVYEKIVQ